MAIPQHLNIINPERSRDLTSFSSFSLLPAELRHEIWQFSLRRPRFIIIELSADKRQLPCETCNKQRKTIRDWQYCITANGSSLLSKLLRVNREARDAALRFYRVHLPSHFELGDKKGQGTLFLNPEFDMLHIDPEQECLFLADFFYDMRAHDPRNIGLLNLALKNNNVGNLSRMDFPKLKPEVRATFIDTLANLRQVYFLCLECAGRIYHGPLNGIHTIQSFEFHRSRPIMSTIPTFDRVGPDPRVSMNRDMSRVYVGTFDPRQMVYGWLLFLDTWKISHRRPDSGGPEYRFLVSYGWGSGEVAKRAKKISGRESAAEWLDREDAHWAKCQEYYASTIPRLVDTLPIESPEELERVPRPAVGFWLFPLEALGPMPGLEGGSDEYGNSPLWRPKRVVDMRQHWPELCLASMP